MSICSFQRPSSNYKSTESDFFHPFNVLHSLHEAGKQGINKNNINPGSCNNRDNNMEIPHDPALPRPKRSLTMFTSADAWAAENFAACLAFRIWNRNVEKALWNTKQQTAFSSVLCAQCSTEPQRTHAKCCHLLEAPATPSMSSLDSLSIVFPGLPLFPFSKPIWWNICLIVILKRQTSGFNTATWQNWNKNN